MIAIQLCGGLGNQLFQYAIARHIAYVHNTIVKLDVKAYKKNKMRAYGLAAFKIHEKYLSRLDKLRIFINNKKIIREQNFSYDNKIISAQDNSYLVGYFQSAKYFNNIQNVIRTEITVKYPQLGRNRELAESIKNSESISIHIRRGDYINNAITNKFHGICSVKYYNKAIDYITKRINTPYFFIFSDDIEWTKENIVMVFPNRFVDNNDASKDYEDLRLMSQCKHNIIANSTFSWWGAWLNKNPEKIILAPKRWFANEQVDTRDLIPEEWIRI